MKDAANNEFVMGSIVKMFHFKTKSKKYWMYKQVVEINNDRQRVGFCHLPIRDGRVKLCFSCGHEELKKTCLIVQAHYKDYRNLKTNKYFR